MIASGGTAAGLAARGGSQPCVTVAHALTDTRCVAALTGPAMTFSGTHYRLSGHSTVVSRVIDV